MNSRTGVPSLSGLSAFLQSLLSDFSGSGICQADAAVTHVWHCTWSGHVSPGFTALCWEHHGRECDWIYLLGWVRSTTGAGDIGKQPNGSES